MGSKGSSSSTSQSSQAYTPTALPEIKGLWDRINQVSLTPYAPYDPDAMIAPINAGQTQAIGNIQNTANANGGQGVAQPYIDQATQLATQGSGPIAQSSDQVAQSLFGQNFGAITAPQQQQVTAKQYEPITRYYNPFQSSVIDATTANMQQRNKEQELSLRGNVTSQGGLGNERFYAAALPQLYRQQNLADNQTIAGLNAQNYTQAMGAAQADRTAAGQGAYALGNLGTTAQGAQLAGNQAALQASTVQQQNAQQLASAKLQEFMRKEGYPFQTTQFLAGLGLPTLQAEGGTSTGTGNQSGSTSSGGGIGGIFGMLGGLFGADGGRVPGMADGGGIGYAAGGGMPASPFEISNFPGYVPNISPPALAPPPHFSDMKGGSGGGGGGQQGQNPNELAKQVKQFAKLGSVAKKMFDPSGFNPQSNAATNTISGGQPNPFSDSPTSDGGFGGMMGDTPGDAGMGGMDGGFGGMLGDMPEMGDMGGSDMGGDLGSLDYGYARGGAAGGSKRGKSSHPFHVDSLIETAHKIKHGLRSMPKHFASGGRTAGGGMTTGNMDDFWYDFEQQNPRSRDKVSSDAFGWYNPNADEISQFSKQGLSERDIRNAMTSITGYEPGSTADRTAGFDFSSPFEGTAANWAYGKTIAGQREKYPTTQLDAPASMAQPVSDSFAEPVRAGVAAPIPEEAVSGMDMESNPFAMAADRSAAPAQMQRPRPSYSRPSPERARLLGMRPNEISGFNEATGEYSPAMNLYRGQTADTEMPMEAGSPMGGGAQPSSARGEGTARQVSTEQPERDYDEGPRRRSVDDSARAFLRNIYSQPPAAEGTGLIAKMARTFQGTRPTQREQIQAATNMMHYDTAREQLMPLGTDSNTGHPLLYDRRSGRTMDAITGKPLTGEEKVVGVGAGGKQPAQLIVADALVNAREESRKTNPNLPPLSREEAIMQAKKAQNDPAKSAEQMARTELNTIGGMRADPTQVLNKWRGLFGLPPLSGAAPAAAPGASQAPAGNLPIALNAGDPGWKQKYEMMPSGGEFLFTDKDGMVKRGKKP